MSKFEDLIGFLNDSRLDSTPSTKEKGAPKSCRKGKILKAESKCEKEIISKECTVSGHSPKGNKDVCPAHYLTSADQVISG